MEELEVTACESLKGISGSNSIRANISGMLFEIIFIQNIIISCIKGMVYVRSGVKTFQKCLNCNPSICFEIKVEVVLKAIYSGRFRSWVMDWNRYKNIHHEIVRTYRIVFRIKWFFLYCLLKIDFTLTTIFVDPQII